MIEESLDYHGIKSRDEARELVRRARAHRKLTESEALAVAREEIKPVRGQR
ncbi:hypothetical protein [Accumulibacter sp.]|uniref:hypothetical protein n=1 Tax=Accumulibacter sp. TaxID=2053492 RepID=UPI0025E52F1C|nr:hypothetical protein [Accumulibacter sp.]